MIAEHDYSRPQLQADQSNTLSKIIKHIPQTTQTLLDVGCATGELGHYLQQHTQIIADAIEAHPQAQQQAATHYRTLYLLDLDQDGFQNDLDHTYDTIILADVLEHLLHPQKVLEALLTKLNPQGKILISLPNVGHNSVIIQLLNAQFHYTGHGLLDHTHLRFFSHQNLEPFFSALPDTYWNLIDRVQIGVQGTEFQELLQQGYPHEVIRLLNYTPEGNTYQFIIELTKDQAQLSAPVQPRYNPSPCGLYINPAIFYQHQGDSSYQAEQQDVHTHTLTREKIQGCFTLPPACTRLRFDPIDLPGLVKIHSLKLTDVDQKTLWQLDGQTQVEQVSSSVTWAWSEPDSCLLIQSNDYDPWIELPAPTEIIQQAHMFHYEITWPKTHDYWLLNQKWQQKTQQLHNELARLNQQLQTQEDSPQPSQEIDTTQLEDSQQVPILEPTPTSHNNMNMKLTLRNKIKTLCRTHPIPLKLCRKLYVSLQIIKQKINANRQLTPALPPAHSSTNLAQWQLENNTQRHRQHQAYPVLYPQSSRDHQVLAFYLPQFHAFPENDQWWGAGFTEWTNVSKAIPQFIGHNQPKLPADLGFYDLSQPRVMHQQAQLAKQAGIDAFCVYYYWFAGKTLMETPLQNWLNTPELDFPLCLCWANENWTRRWDGQDQQILIAQDHSPEDDLAFIRHITPYLLDPRYHRIDNKPLLILYYPSLLPDAKQTAQRWRDHMRTHHQTELYLMCAQSRDQINPRSIGFDAAIEFPPNGVPCQPVTEAQTVTQPQFKHQVYDYDHTVKVLINQDTEQSYPKARGVMPGWDNTARRNHDGNVFINTSPQAYATWLHDAILTTRWQQHSPRLTFINAWNEWAEGAYLEPDQRYGYAYLNATADAINHWQQPQPKCLALGKTQHDTALLIHAYYPEVLGDIQQRLQQNQLQADIWITITDPQALKTAQQHLPQARIYLVPNLGRDVAPYLSLYPLMAHYQVILKIHTKKSIHRTDGNQWRSYLYDQLLPRDPATMQNLLKQFNQNHSIGLLSPDGHHVPLKKFYGNNRNWINRLIQKLDLPQLKGSTKFIAGTMFWYKPTALNALIHQPIQTGDFYHFMPGQIDGSLAHALERIFSHLAHTNGWYTEQVSTLLDPQAPKPPQSKYLPK